MRMDFIQSQIRDNKMFKFLFSSKKRVMGLLLGFLIVAAIPITLTFLKQRQDIRQRAEFSIPDISKFAGYNVELRVDQNGDGIFDSYYAGSQSGTTCILTLYKITDSSKIWSAEVNSCNNFVLSPVFYTKSFMGDSNRDFTIIYYGLNGGMDYHLVAGDGATGQIRFDYFMGDAPSIGILRLRGVVVADFKLSQYPGPSLFIRKTGTTDQDQKGHLFYFPQGSNSYIEITPSLQIANVPPGSQNNNYAFPGVDHPNDIYTQVYNAFNWELPCLEITEVAQYNCGVPDDGVYSGMFLDKAAVGDIDADGTDDILTTYFWRSTVYPGHPKGQVSYLGQPSYDNYYNPQNDGSYCHSGRHYGESVLAQTDSDSYLETIDLAGTTVNAFGDPYQNVSRNIALIDTLYDAPSGQIARRLSWNKPMNTVIPGCNMTLMFDNSIHIPDNGTLRDTLGKTKFVHFNRWTQTSPSTLCSHTDIPCHFDLLNKQTGFWSWEVLNASDGTLIKSVNNTYVWDVIPDGNNIWIIYSADATIWNLGFTDSSYTSAIFRGDLKIGYYDTATRQISNLTPINIQARPRLQSTPWPSFDPRTSDNFDAVKIMTVKIDGLNLPGIVFSTPSGYNLYAKTGSSWNLISSDPPLSPTSTPQIGSLIGSYKYIGICTSLCTGEFVHTMNITNENIDTSGIGTFSGSGYFDADTNTTWNVAGSVNYINKTVSFHIVYTGSNAGYTADSTGTIAPDGTMAGTGTTSQGQTATWTLTRINPTATPTNTPFPSATLTPTLSVVFCQLKSQGDANCDGKVNTDDFNIWRDEFLNVLGNKSSDFNNNGTVNTDDFNAWRDGFLDQNVTH